MFRVIIPFFILTFAYNASAINILAIVSVPIRSHSMAFQQLFRELAYRGHSVTVINNYPDDNPVKNLKFVDLEFGNPLANGVMPLEFVENYDSRYLHLYHIYKLMLTSPKATVCEELFTNKNVKALLDEKYDLIFVEQFMSDCGLVYAAAMYDAPIIGITSHVLLPWAYPRLGIHFDIAADSFYFSNSGPNPSILLKLEATFLRFAINNWVSWVLEKSITEVFSKHLPDYQLDVDRVAKERMKMMFAYQHFSLTGARPLAPQLLEIGGIHIRALRPVPEEIERLLGDAKHGAIFVSFGSNLLANSMSKEKLQHFLDAFKEIPQKVLWKFENASLPSGNKNVYTHKWMPQLDILCHPKVVAFVSHGGMLSISEAAHCGKPVLAMPFFGDQFNNVASLRSSGLGISMHFQQLNADNFAEGLKKVTSQEMQQSAKRVSKLWHDRPQSVMDSAIYWTEYVARHRSAAPPSLPSKNNSWFESLHLDVAIAVVLVLSLLIAFMYISVRVVLNLFTLYFYFILLLYISLFRKKKVKIA